MGLASLAEIFDLSLDRVTRDLVTSQAINWGNDPFARGAYSYATLKTRQAQAVLRKLNGGAVHFSGEALYDGRDMGTVEAALATGKATAQAILATGHLVRCRGDRRRLLGAEGTSTLDTPNLSLMTPELSFVARSCRHSQSLPVPSPSAATLRCLRATRRWKTPSSPRYPMAATGTVR